MRTSASASRPSSHPRTRADCQVGSGDRDLGDAPNARRPTVRDPRRISRPPYPGTPGGWHWHPPNSCSRQEVAIRHPLTPRAARHELTASPATIGSPSVVAPGVWCDRVSRDAIRSVTRLCKRVRIGRCGASESDSRRPAPGRVPVQIADYGYALQSPIWPPRSQFGDTSRGMTHSERR